MIVFHDVSHGHSNISKYILVLTFSIYCAQLKSTRRLLSPAYLTCIIPYTLLCMFKIFTLKLLSIFNIIVFSTVASDERI